MCNCKKKRMQGQSLKEQQTAPKPKEETEKK